MENKETVNRLENIGTTKNETFNQKELIEEKSKAISHKDLSLKRLDESFNKHIELLEYKKSHLLAYWINDFANYHDEEKSFDFDSLKIFKRGDIVKVNLGFNVGKEMGGLHYCVVINKYDNNSSGTLNVIPLSSSKEGKVYNNTTCVDLGDELYNLLYNKFKVELEKVTRRFSKLESLPIEERAKELNYISKRSDYLEKVKDEIFRMKHGSIAYVNQITTISKQRVFKTPILSGIKVSPNSMDLLDEKIKKLYTK
jgi:mRNA-degrading endonuclease toxin of MazEF toxin-antitoxin module|nr:MAG TPA: PemK-like protein [Bacteriophage sp.]